MKTEIRPTKKGNIVHVSETAPAAVYDFTLFKKGEEIPPEINVIADSEYQGIRNIHEKAEIPRKNPKTESARKKSNVTSLYYATSINTGTQSYNWCDFILE